MPKPQEKKSHVARTCDPFDKRQGKRKRGNMTKKLKHIINPQTQKLVKGLKSAIQIQRWSDGILKYQAICYLQWDRKKYTEDKHE